MTLILGIDPGKTTGWGILRLEEKILQPVDYGESKDTTGIELLPHLEKADIIVIEDFLVRPDYARRGAFDYDDMIAPQVIGSVVTLVSQMNKKFVKQPSSIKPVGYGFLGKKYVKGKRGMHKWDALAHAAYYAVKHLHAAPVSRKST